MWLQTGSSLHLGNGHVWTYKLVSEMMKHGNIDSICNFTSVTKLVDFPLPLGPSKSPLCTIWVFVSKSSLILITSKVEYWWNGIGLHCHKYAKCQYGKAINCFHRKRYFCDFWASLKAHFHLISFETRHAYDLLTDWLLQNLS